MMARHQMLAGSKLDFLGEPTVLQFYSRGGGGRWEGPDLQPLSVHDNG